MRRVHQLMVDAALTGDGFDRMAELAAEEVGRPIGDRRRRSSTWRSCGPAATTDELDGAAAVSPRRASTARRASIPQRVELVVPISFGDRLVGAVGMLAGDSDVEAEASEFLHLAATSSATALALEEARERESVAGARRRCSRSSWPGRSSPSAVARRAAAEGCDLVRRPRGRSVTDVGAGRPREALSVVASEFPQALAELVGDRLYALAAGAAGRARVPVAGLPQRLRRTGRPGTSSHYGDAREIPRARGGGRDGAGGARRRTRRPRTASTATAGSGVYRLLFRALASDPEEVRRFYEDTVAPLVGHDEQYRGDLLPTLEAYLGNDCNMNATARAIYAHRHTVAYRLERVKELTGLDPAATEDRERLGLGLKALRIVEARA